MPTENTQRPIVLELPDEKEFTKSYLLKVAYRTPEAIKIQSIPYNQESELSATDLGVDFKHLEKAVVYGKRSTSQISDNPVYERNPHFEKRLVELQKPYIIKKTPAKTKPLPAPAPAPIEPARPVQSPLEKQVDAKPEEKRYELPSFDGYFVAFSNGKQIRFTNNLDDSRPKFPNAETPESKSFTLVTKLTENSGWENNKPKKRNWLNLLGESERLGANIVAKGYGKSREGLYYLFQLSDDRVLRSVLEYTVPILKEKGITPEI